MQLSAVYEKFDKTLNEMHDENAKLNAKFEYRINDTFKIPLSVTWANRADLLSDEDEIRGSVGFTFDFDALFKPVEDTPSQ